MLIASGIIIFRRGETEHEYLLVQSTTGKQGWTPPKGLLQSGEDALDGARRETAEETGWRESFDYVLLGTEPIFQTSYFDAKRNQTKRSVYFLARALPGAAAVVIQQGEIADYAWHAAARSKQVMDYPEMDALVDEAEAALLLINAAP